MGVPISGTSEYDLPDYFVLGLGLELGLVTLSLFPLCFKDNFIGDIILWG